MANISATAPTVQNTISSGVVGKQLEDIAHQFIHGIPEFIETIEEIGKVVPFLGSKSYISIMGTNC